MNRLSPSFGNSVRFRATELKEPSSLSALVLAAAHTAPKEHVSSPTFLRGSVRLELLKLLVS